MGYSFGLDTWRRWRYYSTTVFRPFNSEVHSASALLPCLHHVPLGSLKIALKRTRPRLRFCYIVGQYSMTEEAWCQEEDFLAYEQSVGFR